jgi:hypothetical protein
VEGYADRLESRHEARIKSGRVLSKTNVTELEEVRDTLTAQLSRINSLLERAVPASADTPQETPEEPAAKTPRRSLDSLRLQTEMLTQQLAGAI